jgi:hypothetical protein
MRTIILAGALLCLPAMAEAARLTSAPLTLDPLNGDPPPALSVIEKITCSVHYSGPGAVSGVLRMVDGGPVDHPFALVPLQLSRSARNFSHTTSRVGDAPVAGVVCDFNFPGVPAALFRALLCIRNLSDRNTACAPVT